jgi:hypothetical protein
MATEALDAWSLGVLAIELVSVKPVFDGMRLKEEVCVTAKSGPEHPASHAVLQS